MTGQAIELTLDGLHVSVGPKQGGRLLAFYSLEDDGSRWDWMRPAPSPSSDPRECASFPLVPFSNRIAGARFSYDGRLITLHRNFPPEPHAIHGMGWEEDWDIVHRDEAALELSFEETGTRSWPWSYTATQRFLLTEHGLQIELHLTNTSDAIMPAGLGMHPYFPAYSDTTLSLSAGGVIEKDESGLPDRVLSDHKALKILQTGGPLPLGLDTGLEDWTGTARIDWPDAGKSLQITAPGTDRAVFYSPVGRDYFCLEPVTHVTNAVNALPDGIRDDGGLRHLEPGECLSLRVNFQPV